MGGANNAVGVMAAYLTQGTAAQNVSGIQSQKNTSNAASNSFDSILNKVTDNMVQVRTVDTGKQINQQMADARSEVSSVADTQKAKDITSDTNVVSDNPQAEIRETAGDMTAASETAAQETESAVSAEITEAINEAGEELISQIAETFDLSEDDIVNAMQVLGLMAADLLNPANLTQLVMQVSGQDETIDLITDSDIYTSLQDLMEGAESMKMGLTNEFNLSEEELETAIEEAVPNFKNSLDKQIAEAEPEAVIQNDRNTVSEAAKPEIKAPVSEAITDTAPIEEKPVEVIQTSSKEDGNKGSFQNGAESANLFNQVMNNIAEAAQETVEAQEASYTDRAQMEDIIRQITDKITISAKAEETSMELALHPASLGNVNVLLTSGRDGIVAKFTAQNQIVKEAVEAQMVQLQQKFDEQGIKVTSIEVTIASHGFEQNLDQQDGRENDEAAQGRKASGLRRINLSELSDEEMEPENDAERIAVQMMEANGNSVDFTA